MGSGPAGVALGGGRPALGAARALLAAAALLLAVPAPRPALGGEVAGVRMPDRIEVSGTELVLNGMGVRRVLLLKAYVAGLYLPAPTRDPRAALDADQVRQVRVQQILPSERTFVTHLIREDFERNAGPSLPAFEPRLKRLLAMFPSVRRGDVTTMTYVPGRGTEVVVAGVPRGVVEGKDFADAMLGAFIGDRPIHPELKARMMGR